MNRSLIRSKRAAVPQDAAKLRMSTAALESMISLLHIPSAFVFALARYHLPTGRGFSTRLSNSNESICNLWYILPVRMQVKCTDLESKHTQSTAGNNQMNPFHYLHLHDHSIDIRSSQIALFSQYNTTTNSTSLLAVNFIDGRWPKSVQEPETRIKGIFEAYKDVASARDPFFVHIVYLQSVMTWWTNALNSMNTQLITYVSHRYYPRIIF